MRTNWLSGTTYAAFQIINELAAKNALPNEFVVLVALIVIGAWQGFALAPDTGGQNASHNAFFSRGI